MTSEFVKLVWNNSTGQLLEAWFPPNKAEALMSNMPESANARIESNEVPLIGTS